MAALTETVTTSASPGFTDWMSQADGAIAVTTYQAGKLVVLGWDGQNVTVHEHVLPRPMGLAVHGSELAVACRDRIIQFTNASCGGSRNGHNLASHVGAAYVPRAIHVTGDVNVHDLAYGEDGLWMVNTRFSCLSAVEDSRSDLECRWNPRFISELLPEDRCHLNGLGLHEGRPKFVTAHGRTNEAGAWRDEKDKGGVLIDVESGDIAVSGLCMPHSPRCFWGKWWMLNSGQGELCLVDPNRGEWVVVCTLPGYARGLSFVDHYALIGLSKIRSAHVFEGVPVQDRFDRLACAIAIVDLDTGERAGLFEFTSGPEELYDVKFMPRSLPAVSI